MLETTEFSSKAAHVKAYTDLLKHIRKLERQLRYAKILCIVLTIFLGIAFLWFTDLMARRNDPKDPGWFAPFRGLLLMGCILCPILTVGIFFYGREGDSQAHSLLVPQRQDDK